MFHRESSPNRRRERLQRGIRSLVLSSLSVFVIPLWGGCAPRPTLQQVWNQYNALPTNKAFAVAKDDNGAWVSGWSWNHQSEQQAITRALAQCSRVRTDFRVTAPCQLYAVNDQRVSQAHSVQPSPSPTPPATQSYAPAISQGTPPPNPRPSVADAEEVPLVKAGGVYTLPVEINGVLTLHFVLDSGAADVNIPADVAMTLLRTGTIKDTDFLPGQTYTLADGSTVKSPRFLLRSLKIGQRRVTNVAASIGLVDSALLLGQSFLGELGAWGIDNQRQVLVIHPSASQTLTDSPPSQPQVAAPPPASMTPRPSVEGAGTDQLYRRALKDYQERNYEAAVVNFEQFLKQSPREHPQAGNAQYLIGEALYAQGQYEAAIVAFDEFVQKYSSDPKVPAVMLKQGYAFAELQNVRMARFFLQQVQQKFPNSPAAQVAAEKLRLLR